jgi:hypothetical protein
MNLQPIPSEFPYIQYEENFLFFFISAERSPLGASLSLCTNSNPIFVISITRLHLIFLKKARQQKDSIITHETYDTHPSQAL